MLFTIPIAELIAEYSIGCMGGTGGNERFVVADSVHMVDNKAFAHGKRTRQFVRAERKAELRTYSSLGGSGKSTLIL